MYLLLLFVFVILALLEFLLIRILPPHIKHSSAPDKRNLEPEEELFLISTTENTSLLPAFSVKVREEVPQALISNDPDHPISHDGANCILTSNMSLGPRQKIVKRFPVSFPARGRYLFRGANVLVSDFLGIKEARVSFRQLEEVVVFPKRLETDEMISALGSLMGDVSVRRFIFEDPVLTVGFRDYTGREPMKAINWKQSARMRSLMVNQYDHTTDLSAAVVLNIDYGAWNTRSTELLEKLFSYTRMVCEALEDKRIRYSFITNAATAGTIGRWNKIEEGLGERHLSIILEGIGRASCNPKESYEYLMGRVLKTAEQGQTYIILTPTREQRCEKEIERLRIISGDPCAMLYADEGGKLTWN